MDSIVICSKEEIRQFIKDAIESALVSKKSLDQNTVPEPVKQLYNRKEVAAFLRISLVTLSTWVKSGLPCHKQKGKVFFDKTEVINYIMLEKPKRVRTEI